MSNLTIAVDDEVIKRARIRAIEEGTSVSARLRDFLAAYAQGREPAVPARPSLTDAGAEGGWLSQLRARVERYGGAEPDEWLTPRAVDAGRAPPDLPG